MRSSFAIGPELQGGRPILGEWSPGIGDPTPLGWIVVGAYFLAAGLCVRAMRRERALPSATPGASTVARLWLALAVTMVLLGINKQLDLQTALTELGKSTAMAQGWYADRRPVQLGFMASVGAGSLAVVALVLRAARGRMRELGLAITGAAFVAAFVVLRACSFHHLDRWLGAGFGVFRLSWMLELAGIACIAIGARRAGSPPASAG